MGPPRPVDHIGGHGAATERSAGRDAGDALRFVLAAGPAVGLGRRGLGPRGRDPRSRLSGSRSRCGDSRPRGATSPSRDAEPKPFRQTSIRARGGPGAHQLTAARDELVAPALRGELASALRGGDAQP